MTATSLVNQEIQDRPPPSKPQPVFPLAVIGLVFSAIGIALMVSAGVKLRDYNGSNAGSTIVAAILVLAAAYPLWPTALSFRAAQRRGSLLGGGKLVPARRVAAAGREEARIAVGYSIAAMIVAGLLLMALANGGAVTMTFFKLSAWRQSFPEMIRAFWTNIWVAVVAQVIVLAFALLLAIMRLLPGRAGAPLRIISAAYCDLLRAVPAIVMILLIVFGVPLAFPATQSWNPVWLGLLSLSLTYSAYVAEVYRAGLTSIHPSQSAAARSLGLSYGQTLRTVLVPQAVRRVIPPLLNDFISLQKDTALLSVAGILDVLGTAQQWENKLFTLAPVSLAAIFFIIITIPQARFVDLLINRDARRRGLR